MQQFTNFPTDRGSKYAVSGGRVTTRAEVKAFLAHLTRAKKFARATHNSWGALLADGPAKGDGGEAGAGAIILRMLEREGLATTLSSSRAGMVAPNWAAIGFAGWPMRLPKAFRVYVEAQHELETPMTLRGCERFDILSCLSNMSKRFIIWNAPRG